MSDIVNINVQQDNDIVNIISSEVTEVIDVNVYETTEEVTLNITEEVIQVNINKVTNTTSAQNLQQVTDVGNHTTNSMVVENTNYYSIIEPSDLGTENKNTNSYTFIGADGVIGIKTNAAEGEIKTTDLTNGLILEFPDKTGSKTIATTEDIPINTSDLTNDSGFITAAEVPTVNDATASVKGILKLTNDLGGTADLPTVPGLTNKVDKVTGKELSANDFTNTLKTKLDGIAAGAEVNVNADWNATSGDAQILNKPSIPASQVNSDWNATSGLAQILNKPSLATVATSGSYTDLSNKPSIPAAQIQSDWTQASTSALDYIKNKPSLAGYGDMFKSTYDTDNTGVVDNAEAIKIIGRNSTGATLRRGTIIYISGSTGNRPNFVKAQANSEATSAGTFGVIADDLANNTDGYALCLGYLDNLDTRSNATYPFTTDTLADGDTIYLSPSNAGYITNVKPSAPNHLVYLGKVTRTHPSLGTIVYRVQNGYELEELHNVAISSVADKQLLSYDNATSLWKNKSVTTADIADSADKRYCTDAQKTIISNTSGTNTGDETTATIKTKLGITTLSGSNTGDQDLSGYVPTTRTVNTKALSADVVLTTADIADSTGKRYQTENQKTYNDATSSIQTQLNAKQAALGYTPYRFIQTSSTATTGTTAETIVATATIAGGTFNSSDIMKMIFTTNKTGLLGVYSIRVKINTSNTLTGATQIAIFTAAGATTQTTSIQRNFSLNGGNIYGINFTGGILTDILNVGGSYSSTALNPANTLYIFFTVQLVNSGDSIIPYICNLTN